MHRHDLILQQINQLAHGVARIFKKQTDKPEIVAQLDQISTSLVGLDLDTLSTLPLGALRDILSPEGPGGVGRWILAAKLLAARAELEEEPQAGRLMAKGQALLELAWEYDESAAQEVWDALETEEAEALAAANEA